MKCRCGKLVRELFTVPGFQQHFNIPAAEDNFRMCLVYLHAPRWNQLFHLSVITELKSKCDIYFGNCCPNFLLLFNNITYFFRSVVSSNSFYNQQKVIFLNKLSGRERSHSLNSVSSYFWITFLSAWFWISLIGICLFLMRNSLFFLTAKLTPPVFLFCFSLHFYK